MHERIDPSAAAGPVVQLTVGRRLVRLLLFAVADTAAVRAVRRRAGLLLAAALVAAPLVLVSGVAGAAPTPVEMNSACALKSNGLMRYVTSTNQCTKNETAVTIKPGPVLLCVQPDGSVRRVPNFNNCKPPALKLTLPPASGTVYFCAANTTGVLRYVTSPTQCTSSEFPVFVSPNAGTIIVKKVTNPSPDPTNTSFSFTAGGGLSPTSFSLKNGQQQTYSNVSPGSGYSVAETVPAGWDLTSSTCSDGSPVSNIDVSAGETVTCTFTDRQRGTIIVKKVTNPSSDTTTSFSFTAGGGLSPTSFSLTNGGTPQTFSNLVPGSGYNVAETVPAGWDLTSSTCSDGSLVTNIDVGPGETVTCTFTDRQRGTIIVKKVTNPSSDTTTSFSFTAGGGLSPTSFSLTNGGTPQTFSNLVPGSGYNVAETVPAGWDLTSSTCSDGSPVTNIDVGPGETVTCTFTDTKLNAAPVAQDQTVSDVQEDTAKTITLTATDADGDTLTFSVTGPSHGSLDTLSPTATCVGSPSTCTADVQYTPDANYNGLDSFTFKANDGTVDSNQATVSITVNAVDDPPVAVSDSATVLEDASATTIDVLANDTDIDGGPKYIVSTTNGTNGATVTITNSGADLTYQPAANFCGADSFTYTLNGGSTATVDVTVTCVNDPPSFTKGADQTNQPNQDANGNGISYTVSGWATNILAGPANESGQTLTFHVSNDNNSLFTTQPAVDPMTGDLTFTTDPTQSGSTTVSVYLTDDGGTANGGNDTSATQTFTISTIFPPPIAVDDSYTATGNVRINVNDATEGVLQRGTNDTLFGGSLHGFGATAGTADGTVPNGSNAVTTSNSGTVVLAADGTFTYDPPPGYTGATDSFYYDLHNGGGDAVGHVTITISDMVWFVDNAAASAGDGRLGHPFNSLAAFQAVNDGTGTHPAVNQPIFLYSGSGAYSGGVTLLNGQKLFGQGATAGLATLTGITLAPFSDSFPATGGTSPSLTTTTGTVNAITLGSGNTVRGLDIGNRTGAGIAGSSFGILTLSEANVTGAGQALNLNTGTANANFGTLSSSSGTNGVTLTSVAGSPSATGGSLSGASGDELAISGGGGSFTYPGTITKTGSGKAVNVSGKSGGTVALSGQITDTGGSGSGISLTSNAGATINLTGGITVSTGTSNAFAATGGGTVNVTGSSNTLATTTGTALNVTSTTIGGSGLNFKSISANGAANGIVLNNTGASGGLTVTGDGSNTSLGGNSTGGTISNMVGADGTTAGIGVYLNNTNSVSLSRMTINGTNTNFGVYGSGVNGMTLQYSTVGGVEGTSTANDEGSVIFDGLTGTSTFSKVAVSGSIEDNFRIRNSSGTSNVTIDSSTFTNAPNDNIIIEPSGTSNVTAHVTNNTFTGAGGDHLQTASTNSSTLNIVFTGNFFSNGLAGSLGGGVTISGGNAGSTENVNFNISNNGSSGTPLVGTVQGGTINVNEGNGTGVWQGQVSNNWIGNPTVALSACQQCSGIRVENHSPSGTMKAIIDGNHVRSWGSGGAINTQVGDTGNVNASIDLTVTNNIITNPGSLTQHGIVGNFGADPSGTNAACFDTRSNNITLGNPPPNSGFDLRIRQRNSSTVKLPGYLGGTTDTTAVATFEKGQNTLNDTGFEVAAAASGSGGGFVGGAACAQPTVPS